MNARHVESPDGNNNELCLVIGFDERLNVLGSKADIFGIEGFVDVWMEHRGFMVWFSSFFFAYFCCGTWVLFDLCTYYVEKSPT